MRWHSIRRHPWLLLLILALVGGAAFAGVHAWAWYQLQAGRSALARYRHDQARVHLEKCLAIWPASVPAHLLAARAERLAGKLADAERHIDECRKVATPEEADEVAFEWAMLRAALGDLRSVEEALQARALRRPADAPLIWEAMVAGYRRTCRMPEARNLLDAWLREKPDNIQARFLLGEVHRQVGALKLARDEYARVVELDPEHDDARRLLARCDSELGHYEDAARHLDLLLRKFPGDAELSILRARALYDLGQRAEALELLDAVLIAHPEYGPALRERGRRALAAEQYADAETRLRQALRVMPCDYEVNWNLYQALQGLKRAAEAKTQLAQAQQIKDRLERVGQIQTGEMSKSPFDAALQAELGELLLGLGQRDSGERWLQSALQLDPNQPAAHAALARLKANPVP